MNNDVATLSDYITNYVSSNFSVRPDTLDSMHINVRLAVIELQKNNLFPETTIEFTSIDMKDEKRDGAGRVIYNYYELPEDFRQLYNKGPAFEVDGTEKKYVYQDYPDFLRIRNNTTSNLITLHRFQGDHGKRHWLIASPFPENDKTVRISYYSDGVHMPMDMIEPEFYMPVIDHVLSQLGLKDPAFFKESRNDVKRNQQNLSGQGSYHDSFTKSRPRYFGNHRDLFRKPRRR
jgi:hypothetical protein